MQAPSPALSVHDLACRRGERLLFRRLSFALEPGAACHVTGANGAGKTTLIRALAGLMTPYTGEVRREGALGLLDERSGLDPDLPVMRAIGVPEIAAFLADQLSREAMIAAGQQATRNYAKRQFTWFRRQVPEDWGRANIGHESETVDIEAYFASLLRN